MAYRNLEEVIANLLEYRNCKNRNVVVYGCEDCIFYKSDNNQIREYFCGSEPELFEQIFGS